MKNITSSKIIIFFKFITKFNFRNKSNELFRSVLIIVKFMKAADIYVFFMCFTPFTVNSLLRNFENGYFFADTIHTTPQIRSTGKTPTERKETRWPSHGRR